MQQSPYSRHNHCLKYNTVVVYQDLNIISSPCFDHNVGYHYVIELFRIIAIVSKMSVVHQQS